jgi:hypothetical protein
LQPSHQLQSGCGIDRLGGNCIGRNLTVGPSFGKGLIKDKGQGRGKTRKLFETIRTSDLHLKKYFEDLILMIFWSDVLKNGSPKFGVFP